MSLVQQTTIVPARRVTVTERDIALIERQSKIIAQADIAGPLKGKPADIAMIAMKALALGVDPMSCWEDMFVIERRVSISARMRVALARAAGCTVEYVETTDERATCRLRRPGERTWHTLTYTFAQAQKAGLHTKTNWAHHPAAMLRAAAARQLVNMAAQDVLLGIGGMGDVDLSADVDDLDVPDDVIDHTDMAEVEAGPAMATAMATELEVNGLLEQIGGLERSQRAWLSDRLKASGLPPVRRLEAGHVQAVAVLIDAAREFVAPEPGASVDEYADEPPFDPEEVLG